jgi:UDP-N-acetylglucosamine--N-acetylmuramyl-(pentapeptide) pyrophosphoryl-undecaprenol N-acetylglucosamine transferase
MNLKIVIAGGGTGGHLFPGIAVAREFKNRLGAAVTFLTAPKAVTARILEDYGLAWEAVTSKPLKGQGLLARVRALMAVPGSIREAKARLRALQPHLVLGMGGYASGPVGVAAWRLGIPLALHEQNAIPGFTNRGLARLASRIFLSFPDEEGFFPKKRTAWVGNPIREEFFGPLPPRPDSPFTVLITGGSQGARHLNLETLAALPLLADLKDQLLFLHLTGEMDYETVAPAYREAGFAAEVAAFTPEMPALMGQAHLVLSRAGASTLAELAATGRAAILVPYPFAANNHQEFNARFFAAAGAGELVLNKDFTGEVLADKIREFLAVPEKRERMEAAAHGLGRPTAAQDIVQGCLELIEGKN